MNKQKFLDLDKCVLLYSARRREFNEARKSLINALLPLVFEAITKEKKKPSTGKPEQGVTRAKIIAHMHEQIRASYVRYKQYAGVDTYLPYAPTHFSCGFIVLVVDGMKGKEESLYNKTIDWALACELIKVVKHARQECFVLTEEGKEEEKQTQ
jgi:hypothetical protein